jgi:hypothetical protein
MRELQDEVDPEWVHCHEEELSNSSLIDALNTLRGQERREVPHLQNRDWHTIGAQYAKLYDQVVSPTWLRDQFAFE